MMMNPVDGGYSDAANRASDALGAKMGGEEQGLADAQTGDAKGGNPVVEALRVLAMFVQAQGAAGNPQAEAMKQALMAFMQSTKGQGGMEMQGQQQGPAPAQQPAPQQPKSPGEEMAQAPGRGGPTIL